MRRQFVASWVDIYGGFEGLDEDGLLYTPFDPVMLRGENGNILFAEVVVVFPSVLQHGRFALAESVSGGRGVFFESRRCSLCLTHIATRAWDGVRAGAWYVVDMTVFVFFVEFVLRVD